MSQWQTAGVWLQGIDRATKEHFVYRLHDESGEIVYVGRSKNPARRIRDHILNMPAWMSSARSVSMLGPVAYEDVKTLERRQIEKHQPRGNQVFTKAYYEQTYGRPRP